LSVQRSFYPEGDLCHVYLLHPPGGIAGGDQLEIAARLEAGAAALLTTPGATKCYRSPGPEARQTQSFAVGAGASLEWLPQETILFPGARMELSTRVDLAEDARYIGWEINCLGRPACAEVFDHGAAVFRLAFYRAGQPLLLERQRIEGLCALAGAAGLRGHAVFGALYAYPADQGMIDALYQALPEIVGGRELVGITLLDGLLVARALTPSGADCRRWFASLWAWLRPRIIGRAPCPPRIWST
jgi:urease accessory protein